MSARAPAKVLLVAAVAACGGASRETAAPASAPTDPPRCESIEVRDAPGLDAIAGCEVIAGDLLVSGQGLSPLRVVSLARLRAVEGDLVIDDNPELVGVQLAALERVSGALVIANNRSLAALGAPRLAAVGGALSVDDDPALLDVELSALATVGGDLIASGSRQLQRLSLPALTAVGGALRVEDNEQLAELELPRLRSVGARLVVELNPALPAAVAEELAQRVTAPSSVVEDNAPAP